MAIKLDQKMVMSAGSQKVAAAFYFDYLSTGETLTGSPSVSLVTGSTANVQISSVSVSTGQLRYKEGRLADASEAVRWLLTATTGAAGNYVLRLKCGTTSSPANNEAFDIDLKVV